MTSTIISAYLVAREPIIGQEIFIDNLYAILDELSTLSQKLHFPTNELKTSPKLNIPNPEIKVLKYPIDKDQSDLENWFGLDILNKNKFSSAVRDDLGTCKIVVVTSEVLLLDDIKVTTLQGGLSSSNRGKAEVENLLGVNAEGLCHAIIRTIFPIRVLDLIIAANIANVGSLEIVEGVIVQDGEVVGRVDQISTLPGRYAKETAEAIQWPNLQTLELAKVWDWLIRQQGFLDGFGSGSIGRGVNAFANLCKAPNDEIEPIHLFWALVGIEALYVKGNANLLEQVRVKSQILLGEQESFKKKINRMYDFRSRFVHGDLDFPKMYSDYDWGRYDVELLESTSLATAILAASLQELIQRNWEGLHFFYKVSNLPGSLSLGI